jgi:hypothetical protein
MRKLFLSLPLLVLLGCPPPHVNPPPVPGASDCEAAEKRLQVLECKDTRGRLIGGLTLRGKPWGDVCRENIANGVDMKSGCIAQAADCAVVSSCK